MAASVPIRIAVVDPDQSVRSRLAMQLGDDVLGYPSLDAMSDQLAGAPAVVILGPSFSMSMSDLGIDGFLQQRHELGAILVADGFAPEMFQQAMRAGVRDVLVSPVETAQLVDAVNRVGESLGSVLRATGGGPTAPVEGEGGDGHVITVFSAKGGAGTSVVAVNLAVGLAQRAEGPVVLVDADLQFGDVAVMLKLAPQHTIVDAVGSIDRLDAAFLQSLLVPHTPSGVLVLPAPLEPAYADQIAASDMTRILQLLRQTAAYIVVDTPSYFDDKVLTLIEDSDDVLLVAGMDIPNIKNVKIGLQTMKMLNTPMSKIHLVLNRSNSKVKLDVSEVERTLQVKAKVLLPSDIVVPQSVNKGTPVLIDAPKSGVSRALEQLADEFCPVGSEKRKQR